MPSKNKMKVMLIGSPLTGELEAGITNTKVPLGLAYIAAVLEEWGAEVNILDCLADYDVIKDVGDGRFRVGTSNGEIKRQIKDFKPDVVGINCAYSMYEQDSFDVARIVKSVVPKSLVIFGGAHSSAAPDRVLGNDGVDVVVRGEAEYTFREIVEKFSRTHKKSSLRNIKGTIVLDSKGKVKMNPERDFIWKLDELPMPTRHLLRMDKYLNHPLNEVGIGEGPATDMITSRGCPQRCSFCSIFTVWKRVWRTRSAKLVVDEMEGLVKKYGVKHIRIQDDNFSLDKKRVMRICDEIARRGLKFKWDTPNGIAIWTLDEEVLKNMARSGYQRASFGIETGGSKTMKQYIHKPIDYDHCKKIIKICNKLGIFTVSTFIIGFPDETMDDIQKTIDFANDSGLDFALFYVAQPYAGTPLYEQFNREGLLGGIQQSNLIHPTYNTHYFTGKQLQAIQQKAQKDFIRRKILSFLNPTKSISWMFYHLNSIYNVKFLMKMAKNFLSFKHISFFNESIEKSDATDQPSSKVSEDRTTLKVINK
tara:strand:- start:10563 stop:12164 length:1602 start_codon:yes stop_codon:yes gene_type:complete